MGSEIVYFLLFEMNIGLLPYEVLTCHHFMSYFVLQVYSIVIKLCLSKNHVIFDWFLTFLELGGLNDHQQACFRCNRINVIGEKPKSWWPEATFSQIWRIFQEWIILTQPPNVNFLQLKWCRIGSNWMYTYMRWCGGWILNIFHS